MTHVVIDGIEYVPKAEIPPLADDKLTDALKELVSLYYFGDWHKAKCRVWEAIKSLAPELAELVSDDPDAAYHRLSPPDGNDTEWSDDESPSPTTEQDYRELQSQHDGLQSMLFNVKRERDELIGLIKAVAAHSTSTMIDGTRCAAFPWIEYEVVAAKAKGESL